MVHGSDAYKTFAAKVLPLIVTVLGVVEVPYPNPNPNPNPALTLTLTLILTLILTLTLMLTLTRTLTLALRCCPSRWWCWELWRFSTRYYATTTF